MKGAPGMKSPLFSLILSSLVLATLSSCSTTLRVSSLNTVTPVYVQGNAVLLSKKKNEVSVRLISERIANDPSLLPEFLVVFGNSSKAVVDFSTQNVTATSGGKPVRVYTYEKLRKHIETRAAMLAFAGALNGAAQSLNTSMPQTSYSSGSVSAYGSGGGYARGTYTARTTTYNPAASAAAVSTINANTSNHIQNIVASRDAALSDTTSMLRRDTVMPGQAAGGVVKLYAQDLRLGKTLVLTVTVSGETHDFYFDVGKPAPVATVAAQP